MSVTEEQLTEVRSIRVDFAKAREALHKDNSKENQDAFEEQILRRAQAVKFLSGQGLSNRRLAGLFRAPMLSILTALSTDTPEPEEEKPVKETPKPPERAPEVKAEPKVEAKAAVEVEAPKVEIAKTPARRRRATDDE